MSLEYLLNDEGIGFLGELKFEDGADVFNDRELRHMHDVKELTQAVLTVWMAAMTIAAGAFSGLLLFRRLREAGRALERGGRWTIVSMLILGGLLFLSFSFVFVGFHRIFFEGDTWLFFYSDTLIRLFPERFWQQVFAALVALTLVMSGLAILVGRTLAAFPIEVVRRQP
jgi:integral membrane protein (TIGR01906 family)